MKRDILKVHRARGFISMKQAYGKYGEMLPEPSSHHHDTNESAWKRLEHKAARRALNKLTNDREVYVDDNHPY